MAQLQFGGRMYRVFTDEEQQYWADWIRSLVPAAAASRAAAASPAAAADESHAKLFLREFLGIKPRRRKSQSRRSRLQKLAP